MNNSVQYYSANLQSPQYVPLKISLKFIYDTITPAAETQFPLYHYELVRTKI